MPYVKTKKYSFMNTMHINQNEDMVCYILQYDWK